VLFVSDGLLFFVSDGLLFFVSFFAPGFSARSQADRQRSGGQDKDQRRS
jgi:hypothetical protein